jgi:hypothetical protein
MMTIRQDAKDKSICYIEGIIKLPVSIVHNAMSSERVRQNHRSESHLSRRVCLGPAKFIQTNHTVWSSHQPSGKYLAFEVEWPATPKDANYFGGYSILVSVTDNLHDGDLVLVSTEDGFRLLNRGRGGKFTDAQDHASVKRSSFIPIGVVSQESAWLKRD